LRFSGPPGAGTKPLFARLTLRIDAGEKLAQIVDRENRLMRGDKLAQIIDTKSANAATP
jgi:hypothetical protein